MHGLNERQPPKSREKTLEKRLLPDGLALRLAEVLYIPPVAISQPDCDSVIVALNSSEEKHITRNEGASRGVECAMEVCLTPPLRSQKYVRI